MNIDCILKSLLTSYYCRLCTHHQDITFCHHYIIISCNQFFSSPSWYLKIRYPQHYIQIGSEFNYRSEIIVKLIATSCWLQILYSFVKVWRLFTSSVIYSRPIDIIYGAILLYNFRLFERRYGSAKFLVSEI